jgi:ribonuclease HI
MNTNPVELIMNHNTDDAIPVSEPESTANNTLKVYFDGGTHWNNKDGYGSWLVKFNGFAKLVQRTQFLKAGVGHRVTNNVAEYLALKSALVWIETVQDRHQYQVEIWGDSQLVIQQLNKHWKCKNENMKELRAHCVHYLQGFTWKAFWWKRTNSVHVFGH